ncbi:MAG: hydroxymethylglutaryl-CoA synthase [Deltaproteobacteria bacterium]|nr:hydroxymethylglutaryl-CoA synthase [Deltaproteobacteria bacterium]
MAGIAGYGVYVPKYRIKREEIAKMWWGGAPGIKEKSVPSKFLDEDSITMAYEAAQNAFKHSGISPSQIGGLYVASVSGPYIIKSGAAILGEVLDISSQATIIDLSGSTRAATTAFQSCLDAINSGRINYGMVIGTDCIQAPPGDILEHSFGAGAAAFILGKEDLIAEFEEFSSYTSTFTSVWRNSGDVFVQRYNDPRLDRDFGYPQHIKEAVKGIKEGIANFQHVVFSQPEGKIPGVAAKLLKVNPGSLTQSNIVSFCGDLGSGSVLVELAAIFDQAGPGENILAVSYGSGSGSDAISISTLPQIEEKKKRLAPVKDYLEKKEYIDYLQYQRIFNLLKKKELLPDPMSSYGASPESARESEYYLKLKALECRRCGSLNFPRRHYCIDCRGEDFRETTLPREGEVVTYNYTQVVAVSPEEPPIAVCSIRLKGAKGKRGGKLSAMLTECESEKVKIGLPVELIFRRCGQELGLVKYGYKAQPIR